MRTNPAWPRLPQEGKQRPDLTDDEVDGIRYVDDAGHNYWLVRVPKDPALDTPEDARNRVWMADLL